MIEALPIHREIVRLSGKTRPRILFVPTATYDDECSYKEFKEFYESNMDCRIDVLYLLKGEPNAKTIRNKILTSHIIYVSGGNTLKMMRRWRKLGIDNILRRAYNNNIVLSGISAGAICWFRYGHSDSFSFYNPENWDYIRVRGLGFVDLIFCPHYDVEERDKHFEKMMSEYGGVGIALDDNVALEVVDDRFKIIASKKGSGAYRVYKKQGELTTETLKQHSKLRQLTTLLVK